MSAYADRLEALVAEAADRCTSCGKCFEVCPTAREVGLDAGEGKARVGELIALTRVPFFVRVIDSNGTVVVGRDELADYKLSAGSPRGMSREELGIKIPFSQVTDIGAYRIAVGLKPTPDELEFNRRATARP